MDGGPCRVCAVLLLYLSCLPENLFSDLVQQHAGSSTATPSLSMLEIGTCPSSMEEDATQLPTPAHSVTPLDDLPSPLLLTAPLSGHVMKSEPPLSPTTAFSHVQALSQVGLMSPVSPVSPQPPVSSTLPAYQILDDDGDVDNPPDNLDDFLLRLGPHESMLEHIFARMEAAPA